MTAKNKKKNIPLSDVTGRDLGILQLGDNIFNTQYTYE